MRRGINGPGLTNGANLASGVTDELHLVDTMGTPDRGRDLCGMRKARLSQHADPRRPLGRAHVLTSQKRDHSDGGNDIGNRCPSASPGRKYRGPSPVLDGHHSNTAQQESVSHFAAVIRPRAARSLLGEQPGALQVIGGDPERRERQPRALGDIQDAVLPVR